VALCAGISIVATMAEAGTASAKAALANIILNMLPPTRNAGKSAC